jgi:hypothetical protein
MRHARAVALLGAALAAACASEQPADAQGFDASGGLAVVTLLGDDFARLDGERMPLDAVVLRLRLRTRALTPEQLARFVVRIEDAADLPAAAAARLPAARSRLLQELTVMEVDQAEVR